MIVRPLATTRYLLAAQPLVADLGVQSRPHWDHQGRIYIDDLSADTCYLISELESDLVSLLKAGD